MLCVSKVDGCVGEINLTLFDYLYRKGTDISLSLSPMKSPCSNTGINASQKTYMTAWVQMGHFVDVSLVLTLPHPVFPCVVSLFCFVCVGRIYTVLVFPFV